jgi:hypothetical protein
MRYGALLGISLVLAVLSVTGASCHQRESPDTLPQVMLWAWQRPEDLRFIDPNTTGVAPLVGTAILGRNGVRIQRRLNPLSLCDGTEILPVVRIELDRTTPPELNREMLDSLVESIWALVATQGTIHRLQIDFDAPLSIRPFYRELLFALREKAGRRTFLSMTALASWCMEDDWLTDLPVDEIVPMVFGMGNGARSIRDHLVRTGAFPSPECRSAFGIAVGRPILPPDTVRRLYLFSQESWDSGILASADQSTAMMIQRRTP